MERATSGKHPTFHWPEWPHPTGMRGPKSNSRFPGPIRETPTLSVDKENIKFPKEKISEETKNTSPLNQLEGNVDKSIKTEYKTLSGPKITGQTIDLDQFKNNERTIEDARKRKRKRISKDTNNRNEVEKKPEKSLSTILLETVKK